LARPKTIRARVEQPKDASICLIGLTQGKVAMVDAEDYEHLSLHAWCAAKAKSGKFYAVRTDTSGPKRKVVYMHCELVPAPQGMDRDHRNGDTLDNRKQNLRVATRSQNCSNRGLTSANSSGFKGVTWKGGKHQLWVARITKSGKVHHLGYFSTPEAAHGAYIQAARRLHGVFAREA